MKTWTYLGSKTGRVYHKPVLPRVGNDDGKHKTRCGFMLPPISDEQIAKRDIWPCRICTYGRG